MRTQVSRVLSHMSKTKPPLTKKRAAWVEQFKPTAIVRGDIVTYPTAVEQYYIRAITTLLTDIQTEFSADIEKLFKSKTGRDFFTADASLASQTRIIINTLTRQFATFAKKRAQTIAERFTRNLNASNASTTHKSFETLSGGLRLNTSAITSPIRESLKTAINVNTSLIESIASSSVDKMSDATYRSIMGGQGLADLVPFFKKHREITERHARNVALDQTRKAYASLTKTRMLDAGLRQFEWRHSGGGQKPRAYHKNRWPLGLNGGIFDVNDPPIIDKLTGERGLPSFAINCKCVMLPVLDFDGGELE